MKIYAKQVPPEYQESPFTWIDPADEWPGIIFDGNRHYNSHTTPLYDRIVQYYDAAAEYLEELKTRKKSAEYRNVTEIINDFFPALKYREKPYSARDIHEIRAALELYGTRAYYDGDYIITMLSAITGRPWRSYTIRGCCQGDWQEIIYPADDYSLDAIEILEADYFNTGTEWIIHDENTEPETPDEISGYGVYCYGWTADKIRAELADAAGAYPGDVIMYEYAGSYTIPKYELVEA